MASFIFEVSQLRDAVRKKWDCVGKTPNLGGHYGLTGRPIKNAKVP